MPRKLIFALVLMQGIVSAAAVPATNADLGSCSAHFRVTDASGLPVPNAIIHAVIDRNLVSLPSFFTIRGIPWRSKDIRVLTDANGEAVVEGLPEKIKKQLVFDVSKSRFMSLIVFAPENDTCHPNFEVKFE